jgi:hypothetical protein
MGDTDDVLNRLRAMLDHGPKPPSRYDPPRVEETVNKEVSFRTPWISGKLTERSRISKKRIDS